MKPRIRYSTPHGYWILYYNDQFILGRDTLDELWEGWLEAESWVKERSLKIALQQKRVESSNAIRDWYNNNYDNWMRVC